MNFHPLLLLPLSSVPVLLITSWTGLLIFYMGSISCEYGTACAFSTVNDICTVTVDGATTVVEKQNATSTQLYACNYNYTYGCYYDKVDTSYGEYLAPLYRERCEYRTIRDPFWILTTAVIVLAITGIAVIVYHIARKGKAPDTN